MASGLARAVTAAGRARAASRDVSQAGDNSLQQIERAIDGSVVAPVLDHAAGVGDGCAVALEDAADVAEAQSVGHVGQIHGHLAREGSVGTASGGFAQIDRLDLERYGDGEFEDLLEVGGGAAISGTADRKRIVMRIGNSEMHNRNPRFHIRYLAICTFRAKFFVLTGIFYLS
jgi:hypothetical protein